MILNLRPKFHLQNNFCHGDKTFIGENTIANQFTIIIDLAKTFDTI